MRIDLTFFDQAKALSRVLLDRFCATLQGDDLLREFRITRRQLGVFCLGFLELHLQPVSFSKTALCKPQAILQQQKKTQ